MRLRDAVYARAAADNNAADPASLAALLGGGVAAGLLGSTTTPAPPPPATITPWAYLGFDAGAPSLVPNIVEGSFRWWVYDDAHQGYARIDAISGRLLALYPEQTGALFEDSVTREVIYWQALGFPSFDTLAREYQGMLLRWLTFPFRLAHRGA
jgi:hypothetical protein